VRAHNHGLEGAFSDKWTISLFLGIMTTYHIRIIDSVLYAFFSKRTHHLCDGYGLNSSIYQVLIKDLVKKNISICR
jgi:hypothetical protein